MHHKEKKITFNGREIVAREITVAQIEEWEQAIGETGSAGMHKLDALMGKSLPVSGLRLCVPELTDDDLLVSPSEIEKVYDAVQEVNPFFLKYVTNMARLGEELMAGGISEKSKEGKEGA